jgi:type II secretory pathway component PulF
MSIFNYRARNDEGIEINGELEADSIDEVAEIILAKRLSIIEIDYKPENFYDPIVKKLTEGRISHKEIVIFFRQLSVMLEASLPLVKALRILFEQIENKAFKKVVDSLANEVDGGSSLSASMNMHPKVFTGFYVNIVRSGETSGRLSEVMTYLADQREKDYEVESKIKSAMVYPAFILVLLVIVGIVVMVFVVPNITANLIQSGAQLPLLTRILIGISDFMRSYWWLLGLVVLASGIAFNFWLKTPSGRKIFDTIKLKIPIFGGIFRNIYIVRICQSFSTLVKGGVPVSLALNVVKDVVDNAVYFEILSRAVASIDEGNPIAEGFYGSSYVPLIVPQMISVGEESGKLDEVLSKVAEFYSREVDNTIRNLSSLIEPIIMVVLGLGVGLFVAAVIMPMWQLSSAF